MMFCSHAAQGMLLNLTVPETITQEEVGKICLGIYSYANESMDFYFNINFSPGKRNCRSKRVCDRNIRYVNRRLLK